MSQVIYNDLFVEECARKIEEIKGIPVNTQEYFQKKLELAYFRIKYYEQFVNMAVPSSPRINNDQIKDAYLNLAQLRDDMEKFGFEEADSEEVAVVKIM